MTALDARLVIGSVQDTSFARILCDVDWMNEATRQGDPWLTRAVVFVDGRIPFPDWVQERQRELTRLGLTAPDGSLDSKFPRESDDVSAESRAPGQVVARKPKAAYPGAGARRWARESGSRRRTICR